MKNFQDLLVDKIIDAQAQFLPFMATFYGLHQYDHTLGHFTPELLKEMQNKLHSFISDLKEYKPNLKRTDQKEEFYQHEIDLELLLANLQDYLLTIDQVKEFNKRPKIFPEMALEAVFLQLTREFAPFSEKLPNLLSRLKEIPCFLKECRSCIKEKEVPELFAKMAIELTASSIPFINELQNIIASQEPKVEKDLEHICSKAKEALDDYKNYLEKEVLPQARGTFAIGKELFNEILKVRHFVDEDCDTLEKLGEDLKQKTIKEMELLAKEINPQQSWVEIIDAAKRNHPKAEDIKAAYETEMKKARDFVIKKDLLDIPKEQKLELIPTPIFLRGIIPYAAYMPPAPFEKVQTGYFYVTPVEQSFPEEMQEQQLQGHNFAGLPLTALHEAYPGHHLQLSKANRLASKVRKICMTTVFVEGWALYCEEMMYQEGFYTDPIVRLYQLKGQLWRACRVILDVKLQTGKISFDQAVDYLEKNAHIERINAEREVKRYTESPTQPMSYALGKAQILGLKKEYQKIKGEAFRLKEFHEWLLSFGSIPVKLIKASLYH